jgi:uncharacterized protein YktA (UPF0223 family)
MKQEVVYLDRDQSSELVSRIAERCLQFDYHMSAPEMEAMADLLSDIGVKVDDIIDVSRLADEYSINAEVVRGKSEASQYTRTQLQDSLFTWKEDGETCYCIQW